MQTPVHYLDSFSDDVNIAQLGLATLREGLTIIPQELRTEMIIDSV